MSLSVKYIDVPIGAQEEAVAESTAAQPFSNAEEITAGAIDAPWATLEPSSWPLDGSRMLFDDVPENVGWWSKDRTDNDGRFTTPPVITISFPQPYTSTGLTFMFWPSMGQWCNKIGVSWYNGNQLLAQTEEDPDNAEWVLTHAVEAFDRIEISLLGTNIPGQFAKIQQIQIGHVVVFLQDELVKVNLLNEVDPSLCELSIDTMKIEILEKNDRSLIPQKNQEMHLYRDGKQIAAQYITDSSRENQRFYTFSCQSAIGRLEDDFLGGIYNGYPVYMLLSDVLEGFAADWAPFDQNTVTGYLPVCTRREALQQIAFAIGAAVTTQGDGTIRLLPLNDFVSAEFTGSNIFPGGKVSREAQIATVRLFVQSYSKSDETESLINNELISGANLLYVFSSPHYDYQITNGEIVAAGDNWVRITANGEVSLSAKKYVHTNSVKTKTNNFATVAERGNVFSVENATLINSANADTVIDRLYDFCVLKHVLTQEAVITNQKAGQKVKSINPWGSAIEGYIVSMESEFTNSGHTANVQIRGMEVQL